ncbi:hypothetical protein HK405_008908 [Cladochytrium tenue]|nr:hypothetical protein HK405_008908 [Cladochytrium tenue]
MASSQPRGRRQSLLSRPLDAVLFGYFVAHVPITALVDAQIAMPRSLFPQAARAAVDEYVRVTGDSLVRDSPLWLRSIIVAELGLQLPFFFYAAYALYHDLPSFRLPGAIYASHVLTTLIPIYGELLFSPTIANSARAGLAVGVYGTWVVLNGLLLWRCCRGGSGVRPKAD